MNTEAWGCFALEAYQSLHPANSHSFLPVKSMANPESKTSQLIEITGLTKTEAVQLLEATDWVVEEALQLFFTIGRDGLRDALPPQNQWRSVQLDHLSESALVDDITGVGPETSTPTSPGKSGLSRNEDDDDEPVTPAGQVLPGTALSPGQSGLPRNEYNVEEPVTPEGQVLRGRFAPENPLRRRARAIESERPVHLISGGSFHAVKDLAESKGKWILANVQADESESRELIKTVFRNSEIQDIIEKHFILWQTYDYSEEGQKISHWYKIDKKPAVLVVDPHTGYKMDHVEGSVDTQKLIEILRAYTEKEPVKHLKDSENPSSVAPREVGRNEYPALPREPARGMPRVVNIVIRLPYGRRIQRQFLATDPIQVLWSFAATEIPEDKEFVLVSPTQGLKLNFDDQKSIEEAGVADSVLTLFFRK